MANYQDMSVDELRDEARGREISGVWEMNKKELVDALAGSGGGRNGGSGGGGGGGGKQAEREMADAAGKSGKVIHDPAEDEDREGQTLVTRDHDVIRQWVERRGGEPATVDGTEHGDHLGVLRFDFPGYGGQSLRKVTWDEWFKTFDDRGLNFLYQEHKSNGSDSNFFRLENPDRNDA
jgi:hypothetical protein